MDFGRFRESARDWRKSSRLSMTATRKPARSSTLARLFEMWPPPKMKPPAGGDALDEHVQLPSADQAVVVRGVLPEAEGHVARLIGGDHFARRVPDLGFHAAAADGAHHRTVFADQQFRALKAGDGPLACTMVARAHFCPSRAGAPVRRIRPSGFDYIGIGCVPEQGSPGQAEPPAPPRTKSTVWQTLVEQVFSQLLKDWPGHAATSRVHRLSEKDAAGSRISSR